MGSSSFRMGEAPRAELQLHGIRDLSAEHDHLFSSRVRIRLHVEGHLTQAVYRGRAPAGSLKDVRPRPDGEEAQARDRTDYTFELLIATALNV